MTRKEDIERAVKLIREGRDNPKSKNLSSEHEEKVATFVSRPPKPVVLTEREKVWNVRKDLVRNTGVVGILEGLVENGTIENADRIQWDSDGFGFKICFNNQDVGQTHSYNMVEARLTRGELTINGVLVKSEELVERIAESIVSPKQNSYERTFGGHTYDGSGY